MFENCNLRRAFLFVACLSCVPVARGQDNSTASSGPILNAARDEDESANSIVEASEAFIDPVSREAVPVPRKISLLSDGLKTEKWFRDKGVEFHANLKTEMSSDFHSGLSSDGTDYRALVETDLSVDLHKAAGWNGAQIQASFHDYFGSNGTEQLTEDVQGFSNIDSYPANRIYELWFQQSLASDTLRIKLGRIDANTEFAYVQNASDFLNSSMGYSPTILDMHSYPNPRLGAMVGVAPVKFLSVSAAIFHCLPSGSMVLGEVSTRWRISKRLLNGRLAEGFWIHPHTIDGFDGKTAFGVHGYYAVLEQTLWKRDSEAEDESRGIRAFGQWGDANPWFNGIAHHLGAGFEWTGATSRRAADIVGVGITTVWLGEDFDRDTNTGRERSIEAFCKLPLRSWLSITPDFQWIMNPSGSMGRPRAFVGSARMAVSF